MNSFVLSLLMAVPQAGGETAGAGSLFANFIPLILIVGIFYFLIIRPQSKKRKETERMIAAIKKGDRIVTIGGIHGIVQSVKDTTVIIKVDDNVKIEFLRNAVSSVITASKEEKKVERIEDKNEEKEESE
ncbi:MAG: preprotein translocase subunit YajC [Treponema sp.]|jgi:preprotein translocase subunit YajC|nr:preprotein translocase subunit YajC [Treponema sp.]